MKEIYVIKGNVRNNDPRCQRYLYSVLTQFFPESVKQKLLLKDYVYYLVD